MILQLGNFQFEVHDPNGISYQTLERASAWKWEEVPIAGDYPILQLGGKESPTITFNGVWFNYYAATDKVQSIEDLGNETEPLALTGDDGHFYGFWVIVSLRRSEDVFRPGQRSAIKTEWTVSLKFYGKTKERGN